MDQKKRRPPAETRSKGRKHGWLLGELRRQIVAGEFAPGGKLPPRLDLMTSLGVSSIALQQAVDRLEQEGFLVTQPRLGTYVAARPPHLSHYGLVFHPRPEAPLWWNRSRFLTALAREAQARERRSADRFPIYSGVSSHADCEYTSGLMKDVAKSLLAGLILTAPFSFDTYLLERPLPCVAFMRKPEIPGVHIVELDIRRVLERALDAVGQAGRKRVGLLAADSTPPETIAAFLQAAAHRSIATSSVWIHGVNIHQPHWAENAVLAMMQGPLATRPEALIISDDHLVEPAARALAQTGVRSAADMTVIGYANHGWSEPAALPMQRLGFVIGDLLDKAVDIIDRINRGQAVPLATRIAPVFDWELPAPGVADAPSMR